VLTVGFTLLFTALSSLCAAYVVKAVQFFKARQAETRKLRTPESGRQLGLAEGEAPAEGEGEDLLELELLVRVTSSRMWWVAFQVRGARHAARSGARNHRGPAHAFWRRQSKRRGVVYDSARTPRRGRTTRATAGRARGARAERVFTAAWARALRRAGQRRAGRRISRVRLGRARNRRRAPPLLRFARRAARPAPPARAAPLPRSHLGRMRRARARATRTPARRCLPSSPSHVPTRPPLLHKPYA
jgi:hypothetical protein